jgi:branched-subunit amino acid transport protein
MNNWTLIAVAALASYSLRALPIVVFRRFRIAPEGDAYKFLSYAAFSVMGGIIYSALFGAAHYDQWLGHFTQPDALLKLSSVVLAAVLAAWLRGVFKVLIICIAYYFVMDSFFVQGLTL